ncbi:hypothetical protein [Blastococcus capsensis]|uniref:hypothetical protein n=1 Tax=Blastococcus capsensis TaxID=1564163 RepID=UPI0025421FEB|nr:hypothetical protein [Blastococcus capsensis]MDK3258517.1 hypothetical protein [Blastococcus capsensis]
MRVVHENDEGVRSVGAGELDRDRRGVAVDVAQRPGPGRRDVVQTGGPGRVLDAGRGQPVDAGGGEVALARTADGREAPQQTERRRPAHLTGLPRQIGQEIGRWSLGGRIAVAGQAGGAEQGGHRDLGGQRVGVLQLELQFLE